MRLLILAGIAADLAVGADLVGHHSHGSAALIGGGIMLAGGAVALWHDFLRPAFRRATLLRDE